MGEGGGGDVAVRGGGIWREVICVGLGDVCSGGGCTSGEVIGGCPREADLGVVAELD